jgi:hypothetical protein
MNDADPTGRLARLAWAPGITNDGRIFVQFVSPRVDISLLLVKCCGNASRMLPFMPTMQRIAGTVFSHSECQPYDAISVPADLFTDERQRMPKKLTGS